MRTERHLNGSPKSQNTAQPDKAPFPDSSELEQLLEDVEVPWLTAALARSIANLGYPVGMGLAPKQEDLEQAARNLFKRYSGMIARSRSLTQAPRHG